MNIRVVKRDRADARFPVCFINTHFLRSYEHDVCYVYWHLTAALNILTYLLQSII